LSLLSFRISTSRSFWPNVWQLPSDVIAAVPQARLLQEAEPGPGPARNKDASEAKVLTCP